MPGVETLAIKTPDDLPAARALLQRHVTTTSEAGPSWRIAVAPVGGTFRAGSVEPGAAVAVGGAVGIIESRRDVITVSAAHGGVLVEWLAHDGDPVSPGQPVALLHPEPVLA
jgi:[acyl-carrier-protein] S-malonyltransferase